MEPDSKKPRDINTVEHEEELKWPVVGAWAAFIIGVLLFISTYLGIKNGGPYTGVAVILVYLPFGSLFILLCLIACYHFARKKSFSKLKTVTILMLGFLAQLIVNWGGILVPSFAYSLNKAIGWLFPILMVIAVFVPLLLAIKFSHNRGNDDIDGSDVQKSKSHAGAVIAVVGVIIVAISLIMPIKLFIGKIESDLRYEEEIAERSEQSKVIAAESEFDGSDEFARLMYDVCRGGTYEVIYYKYDETGLFQCEETNYIYSVTNMHDSKNAGFSFLGVDYDEEMERYFNGLVYVYINPHDVDSPNFLSLLVEAESEDGVIENYGKVLYEYYMDNIAGIYSGSDGVYMMVFYNDSLDNVTTVHDYAPIARFASDVNRPSGGTKDSHWFSFDDANGFRAMLDNKEYSSPQVREAVESNRHIDVKIPSGEDIGFEEFCDLLRESFIESTGEYNRIDL